MSKATNKSITPKPRKKLATPVIVPEIAQGPSTREIRFVYFSAALFTLLSIKCEATMATILIVSVLAFAASKMWLTHKRMNPLASEMLVAVLLAGVIFQGLWLGRIYLIA